MTAARIALPHACRQFCACVVLTWAVLPAVAQPTAFSFQGQLIDTGQPADGLYDFQFTFFDAAAGGSAIGTLI